MGAFELSTLGAEAAEDLVASQAAGGGSAEKPLADPGGEQAPQSISDCSTDDASTTEEEDAPGKTPKEGEEAWSPRRGRSPSRPEAAACIIFDWDDTLLPTTFLNNVAQAGGKGYQALGGVRALALTRALADHADLVRRVLVGAREVGHVAIVTSSVRPWVDRSAQQHLPGLDVPRLLRELGIPVLYASGPCASSVEGLDMLEAHTERKRSVMAEFVGQVCRGGGALRSAVSVGDSPAEREALKRLARHWEQPAGAAGRPSCKTVKLMSDPSLRQLGRQLQALAGWLDRVVSCDGDVDVSVGPREDLETKLWTHFGPRPEK